MVYYMFKIIYNVINNIDEKCMKTLLLDIDETLINRCSNRQNPDRMARFIDSNTIQTVAYI